MNAWTDDRAKDLCKHQVQQAQNGASIYGKWWFYMLTLKACRPMLVVA